MTNWPQIEREVRLLLRDSSLSILTTMLDYYAFPGSAPGMADRPNGSPSERVEHVELALADHFNDQRLVPHLILHETETWVYAARHQLGELFGNRSLTAALRRDIDAAGGVEMVNDNPSSAPSKRLKRHCAEYVKHIDGPLAIAELGLDMLRRQCPHLDGWLARLET